MNTPENINSYAEASQRLQTILQELDKDSCDFDKLTAYVQEASDLIKFCKMRIASTELSVKEILENIDAPASSLPDLHVPVVPMNTQPQEDLGDTPPFDLERELANYIPPENDANEDIPF